VHTAKSGQKTWYARHRIGGKQVAACARPVKDKGAKVGLNKSEAANRGVSWFSPHAARLPVHGHRDLMPSSGCLRFKHLIQ
jgi:hypothetical protein